MKNSENKSKLEERLSAINERLACVEDDLQAQREHNFDVAPLYLEKNRLLVEKNKVQQELETHSTDKSSKEIQYDKQSILSSSIVRRKERKELEKADIRTVKEQTSTGEFNETKKQIGSRAESRVKLQKSN